MRLYKFRSLGDTLSLERAINIIKTGEFWCSKFWDMNDPMEGVFQFSQGTVSDATLAKLFGAKNHKVLCSFAGENAFRRPAMWGYYANGFKGIAIEIEIDSNEVHRVTYSSDVAEYEVAGRGCSEGTILNRILTTKLSSWEMEDEYRFIIDAADSCSKKIGEIKALHLGCPYRDVINRDEIFESTSELAAYQSRRKQLHSVALELGLNCRAVRINRGTVESDVFPDESL